MGRLYENAVLLELKRGLSQNQEINYWRNPEGTECDFIIREGLSIIKVIQVAYQIQNEKTRQREVKGVVSCANELNLREGLIITKGYEPEENIDNKKIKFIPLWKWLLRG